MTGFEYLSDMVVFDLLRVRMLHGWLVDPSDEDTARVFGRSSYNHLEDRLVLAQVSIRGFVPLCFVRSNFELIEREPTPEWCYRSTLHVACENG